MIRDPSYRKAFFSAVFLHIFLGLVLLLETVSSRPTLVKETKNEPGQLVKAVSVDNQEVMNTVNRLKQERARQEKAEQAHQLALKKQADSARMKRLQEQKRLAKLKEETATLALAKKKELEEEQKHLKQLTLQKEQETKRLEELKNKHREEREKLAELKKRQAEEQMKLAKKEEEAKMQAARAEAELAEKARIAGEVDKYKALIVNAISRQWILPENVDSRLSSQFRIRLGQNGAVLDVSLIRSSGDPVLDRSAQMAIYKASPLPVPTDPATFDLFRDISLTVRPENVRG